MADLHPRKPLSPAEIVILPKCCTEFHRTAQSKVTSIPVASVKEAIYRGSEGERYLDFTSQPRIRNIGNGYPCVVRIVAKPISDLAYVNSVTMTTAVHALLSENSRSCFAVISTSYFHHSASPRRSWQRASRSWIGPSRLKTEQ